MCLSALIITMLCVVTCNAATEHVSDSVLSLHSKPTPAAQETTQHYLYNASWAQDTTTSSANDDTSHHWHRSSVISLPGWHGTKVTPLPANTSRLIYSSTHNNFHSVISVGSLSTFKVPLQSELLGSFCRHRCCGCCFCVC